MQKWIADTNFKGHPQAPFPVCAPTFNAAMEALRKDGYEVLSLTMCVGLDPALVQRFEVLLDQQAEVIRLLTENNRLLTELNRSGLVVSGALEDRRFLKSLRNGVADGISHYFWLCFLWSLALGAVAFIIYLIYVSMDPTLKLGR